jgi:hypothetical protein
MYRSQQLFMLLILAGWLIGCSSPGGSPTAEIPAEVPAQILPTQSATELLRISGSGAPYTSEPLKLSSEVTLVVHWEQSSLNEFSFIMVNQNTTPVEEIMFELAIGPSTGAGEVTFTPGDYAVKVTAADGPWLIWIETVELPQADD